MFGEPAQGKLLVQHRGPHPEVAKAGIGVRVHPEVLVPLCPSRTVAVETGMSCQQVKSHQVARAQLRGRDLVPLFSMTVRLREGTGSASLRGVFHLRERIFDMGDFREEVILGRLG